MNTNITALEKPQYTGISITFGYLSVIKPGIKGPSTVIGGLISLMGGFMYAYQNSAGRLMGFFPNDGKVASYQKRGGFSSD